MEETRDVTGRTPDVTRIYYHRNSRRQSWEFIGTT
jgi:hypothetical protein